MRLITVLWAIVAAVVLQPASGAAAPQVLALLETRSPIKLTCAGGICKAELSAYCLTQGRDPPRDGTAYQVPAGAGITIAVIGQDGRTTRMPVRQLARFRVVGGEYAVQIAIARDHLAHFGAGPPAVIVTHEVSLTPVPVVGDGSPLGEAELAQALGPLRHSAQTMEERGHRNDADIAHALARQINGMRPAVIRLDAARRQATRTGGAAGPSALSASGYGRYCRSRASTLDCLRQMRDLHLWRIREAFRARNAGS